MNASARKRTSTWAAVLALAAIAGVGIVVIRPARGQAPSTSVAPRTLRDVFVATEQAGEGERIGRLGIHLQTEAGWQAVSPRREFHAGDRFRFDVTTSRPAWVYLFHQAPGEAMKRLWPPAAAPRNFNKTRPGVTARIPETGVFVFDEQAGDERFYVVLRASAAAPRVPGAKAATLAAAARSKSQAATPAAMAVAQPPVAAAPARPSSDGIVNFIVRGRLQEGAHGNEGDARGVLYVPEQREPDQSLYFAAPQATTRGDAVLEIRLNHR